MNHTLKLTNANLKALSMATHMVIKAGTKKEPEMKEHSLEYKVLAENKAIQEILNTAAKVFEINPDKPEVEVSFTRAQVKVAATTIITILAMQDKTLKQYMAMSDGHAAFEDVDGRRKADYVARLKDRIKEVEDLVDKLRGAL